MENTGGHELALGGRQIWWRRSAEKVLLKTGKLVSILIPAYNAQRWIRWSIESALAQTWPKKEIIVVDDGSRDHTLDIARGYESACLKVLSRPRQGAAGARNTALRLAQGDFIQWLDADDLLDPNKIWEQLKAGEISADSDTLLSCGFGKFCFRREKARFEPTSLWRDLSPLDWLLTKFSDNAWMQPGAWLISRRLADAAGPWNETLSVDDDGEYSCRLVACSAGVKFVSSARSYYRQVNLRSLSRDRSPRGRKSLLTSIVLCIGYLRRIEPSERTKRASALLLQRWLSDFYPEDPTARPRHDPGLREALASVRALYSELGVQVDPPRSKRRYALSSRLLGPGVALELKRVSSDIWFLLRRECDRVLWRLGV